MGFDLNKVIFGNTIEAYFQALSAMLVSFLACYTAAYMLRRVSTKFSDKVSQKFIKTILKADQKLKLVIWYVPIYAASQYLTLHPIIDSVIAKVGVIVVSYTVIRYISDIISAMVEDYDMRPGANKLLSNSLRLMIKLVVWSFGILLALNNMGVNVTTLIAGLGVGGMALAFASKEILSDLFNYFIITFDRPFNIGDNITVGSFSGNVKAIGLRGTRLLSSSGEELIMSNTDMTKNVIRNETHMARKRIKCTLGVSYDTSREQMRNALKVLEEIVSSISMAELHSVNFTEFGDSSLNILFIYYILGNDYKTHLKVMNDINFMIYDKFDELGISFAYPSTSVYVEKMPK